jgi:hypothetical protein
VGDQDGVDAADVLDLTSGVVHSTSILSVGVAAGEFAVLHYAPRGSALAQVPASRYEIAETLAEYSIASGAADDFLEIVLARIESRYALPGFAAAFTTDFEAFLQSADSDPDADGVQPYRTPSGNPILTLGATQFFGPGETWPKELENHPYVEFWHRLDIALAVAAIPGLGPGLLNDEAWQRLFASGALAENPGIRMTVSTGPRLTVQRLPVDQLGTTRPAGALGDIGAIEAP